MGLDMYLEAKVYYSKFRPEDAGTLTMLQNVSGLPEAFAKGSISVEATVATWRKANHIHKWFVDRCQGGKDDCQTVYVSRDDLRDLLHLCKNVLARKDEGEAYASQWLPTESGFFFGSTAYDEYYYQDVENTIKMIEPILGEEYKYCSFYYHASW